MFLDLMGHTCFKLGLHTHTKMSDGKLPPEEVAKIYKDAGYDAIAITDHWKFNPAGELAGLPILSGVEYNIDTGDTRQGGCHIVALCMEYDPKIDPKTATIPSAIDAIHAAGGIVVLAHPAWSLCQVEDILSYRGIDATEIYNTVSDAHESNRPYSGVLLDLLANKGRTYPLFASDDAHYYDGTDEVLAATVIRADTLTRESVIEAVRRGDCYGTLCRLAGQPRTAEPGPEVHLWVEGKEAHVVCSPASKISFFSNVAWCNHRVRRGAGQVEAVYQLNPKDGYLRVEVTDEAGRTAFSPYVVLEQQ